MEKMNSAPTPGFMRETAKTPLVANFRVQGSCLEGRALGGGEAFHAAGKVLDDLLSENRGMD